MAENLTYSKERLDKLEAKVKYLENLNHELSSEVEVYKKSLRENYRLMNALFDKSGFGMLLLNPEGIIQRANELFCKISGYHIGSILDRHFSEIINNYSKNKTLQEFKRILGISKEQNVLRYRRKFYTFYKEPVYLDLTISVNHDLNYNVKSVIILIEDKTQKVKTAKIKSALYNIARDTYSTKSLDTLLHNLQINLNRIINIKNFFVSLYEKEEHQFYMPYIKDKKNKKFQFPAEGTLGWHVLKQKTSVLIKEKEIKALQNKNIISSDEAIPKVWLGIPLTVNNEPIGVIGIQNYEDENIYNKNDLEIFSYVAEQIVKSIERKIWEEQLAKEKANFQFLFDNSPDAITLINPEGRIIKCNNAFTKTFGFVEQQSKYYYSELLISTDEYKREFNKFLEKTIKSKQGTFIETKRIRQDGEILNILLTSAPVVFEGETQYIYIIHRDITENKMHEKAIIDALEKAEESDKLKTSFLANLSHEVRTPLNAVVGFSGLLISTKGSGKEQRERFVQHITNSSDVLVQLIDNIIDMSKIEAGQLELEFSKFEVNSLLNEIFSSFQNKIKNNNLQTKISLNLQIPEDDHIIYTDKIKIQQIITAILDNAIKYTPDGEINFGYNSLKNNKLTFFIEDSGIGIDKSNHEKIFERFVKIEENPNRIFRGTGIGLFIAKSFAELLNGDITVESEVNKGSKFNFTLPISTAANKETTEELVKSNSAFNWSTKTILIVEDVYTNFVYLEAALKKTKVKLLYAENGKSAIKLFNGETKPDLILLDLQLPDINGFEVAQKIRANDKKVPIIVQTAYTMNTEQDDAKKYGCNDFLSKPIRQGTLINSIAKYFI